jgi:hypothetical protein
VLIACGLLAGARAAPAAAPPPLSRCAPPGAHILAANRLHEVYVVGEGAFACNPAEGPPIILEARGPETGGRVAVTRAALAREVVALVVSRSGVDTSCSEILVLDLAQGTNLRPPLAVGCTVDAGFVAVHEVLALVASPRGSVAWALLGGRAGAGRVSVLAAPHGRPVETLDPGPDVSPGSLRLSRGVVSWRDAGRGRSARL